MVFLNNDVTKILPSVHSSKLFRGGKYLVNGQSPFPRSQYKEQEGTKQEKETEDRSFSYDTTLLVFLLLSLFSFFHSLILFFTLFFLFSSSLDETSDVGDCKVLLCSTNAAPSMMPGFCYLWLHQV